MITSFSTILYLVCVISLIISYWSYLCICYCCLTVSFLKVGIFSYLYLHSLYLLKCLDSVHSVKIYYLIQKELTKSRFITRYSGFIIMKKKVIWKVGKQSIWRFLGPKQKNFTQKGKEVMYLGNSLYKECIETYSILRQWTIDHN